MASNSSNNNVAASEKEAEEILKMISQMPELASLEKGVLDEKYRLVMAIFNQDLKTKRLAEMRKKIETLHDQQKAGNEKIKDNIKAIHLKEEQIRSSLAKTLEYRANIDDRIDSLLNFMSSSIEPKMQHSLRCLASLTKKISALNDDRVQVQKRHVDLMAIKALKLEKLEEDLEDAIEMEEEADQKTAKFDADTAAEVIKIDIARKSLNEVNVLKGFISTVEKSIGEAEVEIAAINSEMKEKKREASENGNKISSTESLIEQLNTKCDAELVKVESCKLTLQELSNLVEVIQQKSSFEALESDEVFKREAMNKASYITKREKLNHEITASIALADDLQQLGAQEKMLMEQKKEYLIQLGEVQQSQGLLEAQAKEFDQVEAADQLQARIEDSLKTRDNIKKEIGDLKKILGKEQEAHAKEDELREEELSNLSLKLQAEEKKTKEAQDNHITKDVDNVSVASSTSQKSFSDRRATLQPRQWMQPSPSASTSRFAELMADKKKKLSPTVLPPVSKLRTQDEIKPVPKEEEHRDDYEDESRRSMIVTPSRSTSRFDELMADKKKLSHTVSTPVSTKDEVKPVVKEEEGRDDYEDAFFDGETSEMNYTFNTDVSAFLK